MISAMKASLIAFLSAGLPVLALGAPPVYRAGVAKIDITPPLPVRLSGYPARLAPASELEGRLYARALALKDAEGVVSVLLSAESIGLPAAVRSKVCGNIRPRLGIYHERIAFASTNSHAAPALRGVLEKMFELDLAERQAIAQYTDFLADQLIAAVNQAVKNMQPVKIIYGKAALLMSENRLAAGGPVDPDFHVLAAVREDGQPLAAAFSSACRGAALPAEFNRVSGDWPGLAAAALEAAHPGSAALPLLGCAADAVPSPRGSLEHARAHARKIASAVEEILQKPQLEVTARLDIQFEYAPLPVTPPSGGGPAAPQEYRWPMQSWRFGEQLLVLFLGGEVEAAYSLRLRRELNLANLMVCSFANDTASYLPGRQTLERFPAEVQARLSWHGRAGAWPPALEDAAVGQVKSLALESPADLARRVKPPPPKSPAEALATFRLAPGFRLELAAAEPEVADPVALTFDGNGAMYACEMRDYPLGPRAAHPFDGRVRRLEDRDQDGYFETSTVFAAEVPFPTGIAPFRGGVFVTCAPDLIYLKDENGDGRADLRETVFTGFNVGNSQHLLNSMAWGPDNWIYVNGGDFAAIRPGGKEGPPELTLSHSNFRFQPATRAVEPATGYRGGFGLTFDEYNARIVCESTSHAIQVMLPHASLKRNRHLAVDATVQHLSGHGQEIYPASRPLQRFNDPMDAGRFSAASGVHLYAGDQFPEAYRRSLFVCEPVSNLVHRDVLAPAGAAWRADRGEEKMEFLASTDHWFRPVNCATGPDGALYILDMYREVIEHPEWIPAHLQKLFDLRSGMDRGRIYRVLHERGPVGRRGPRLEGAGAAALVEALAHPNGWRRQAAQRLLVERGGRDAVPLLAKAAWEASAPEGCRRALWALEGLGAVKPENVLRAFEDPYPPVRALAAHLSERFMAAPEKIAVPLPEFVRLEEALLRLAGDGEAKVRFQAALSLGALESRDRIAALARIALRDAGDPWIQTAVLTSLSSDPVPFLKTVLEAGDPERPAAELIRRAAALIGSRKVAAEILETLALLTEHHEAHPGFWIVPAVADLLRRMRPLTVSKLAATQEAGGEGAAGDGARQAAGKLARLFSQVAREVGRDAAPLEERLRGVEMLGFDDTGLALPVLSRFLEARYPADLQRAAVQGLARLPGEEARGRATELLLQVFPRQTPAVRREALEALVQEAGRSAVLLAALEEGSIDPKDLDLGFRKILLEREETRARAEKIFARVAVDPDRAQVVERAAAAIGRLEGLGRPERGRELFSKHCSICHRFKGEGTAVGPDLATVANRALEALVIDLLDPSRSVSPEFLNYVLITRDRKIITGLLVTETPTSVLLRRAEGKSDSVLRQDIAELRATGQSVMPEGLEQELQPEELRELILYIKG